MIPWPFSVTDPLTREVVDEYLDEAGRFPTKKELCREVYGMTDEELEDEQGEPPEGDESL